MGAERTPFRIDSIRDDLGSGFPPAREPVRLARSRNATPDIELSGRIHKGWRAAQEEAPVRTNLLLGTAAVGLLITGAIAQTSSSIDRIKDPAGHQNATGNHEAKKSIRTVYPNTQNAEQAIQQSKNAQGGADASKRQPGDVTPLSSAQQQSSPLSKSPAQPAQSTQDNAKVSAPQQSAPQQS